MTRFRNALHIVGPACVLTHGAAALSFIALQLSEFGSHPHVRPSRPDRKLIALVAVLTLIPLLGVLLLRTKEDLVLDERSTGGPLAALQRFCGWIAAAMVTHPGRYTLAGILIIALLGVGYTQLQPRYRLADQVPDREQAIAANTRIDTKLTGSNPIDVLISVPPGRLALCAGVARHHRRRPFRARASAGSATSGRSKRCGDGWRNGRARRMSERSSAMSTCCRSI